MKSFPWAKIILFGFSSVFINNLAFSMEISLNFETHFSIVKEFARKEKPFVLGAITVDKIVEALVAMDRQENFVEIDTLNLRVKGFYYGSRLAVPGILQSHSIKDLNDLIFEQTQFKNIIPEDSLEALAITAVSEEKFEVPFAETATQKNNKYFFKNHLGKEVEVDVMQAPQRNNYRHLKNRHLMGVELEYESGGHLILVGPNTDLNNNAHILDIDPKDLNDFVNELQNSDIKSENAPLTLPKGNFVSKSATLKKVMMEKFSNYASLIDSFEEVIHAATFEITEKGTKGKAVTAVFTRSCYLCDETYRFNRPFLAIVFNKEKRPLFVSYITF